ncbi:MAG: hypothetical protein IPI67_02500 [Myxococcales bacterium]|nr:hypothetical protein [Myxococcales bacterium]
MTLELQTVVDASLRRELETLVAGHRTLDEVVRSGLAREPALLVENVVVQDEYTHDVVMPHPSGLFLVYDTT